MQHSPPQANAPHVTRVKIGLEKVIHLFGVTGLNSLYWDSSVITSLGHSKGVTIVFLFSLTLTKQTVSPVRAGEFQLRKELPPPALPPGAFSPQNPSTCHWFPAGLFQLPNSSPHVKRHLCLLAEGKWRPAFHWKWRFVSCNSSSPNEPGWAGNGERLRACQSTVIQKLS